MSKSFIHQEQFLQEAIRSQPREPRHRLAYARWHLGQGRKDEALVQTAAANQCERFDPDFDYRAYLVEGLVVEKIAAGEIIVVSEPEPPRWKLFCDPSELQEALRLAAELGKPLSFGDLPGSLEQPSQALLEAIYTWLPSGTEPRRAWGSRWMVQQFRLPDRTTGYLLLEDEI